MLDAALATHSTPNPLPMRSLQQIDPTCGPALLDSVFELAARLTRSRSLAVIERGLPGGAVRWLRGSGALAEASALGDALFLLADPGGHTQSCGGVALVPLGEWHAVVVVGAERDLLMPKLEVLGRTLQRLLERATLRSLQAA
ncbi:MAG: hypothetical protein DWQ36_22170 [Acidobacteria bacterium]|nr:MAG: hypothetical protein DWQ30_00370 [Acidobacteriota bacterium]REK00894.1 MAG: hypothetical protein DWQ36_22170 [Acidobacteriota bacterium]